MSSIEIEKLQAQFQHAFNSPNPATLTLGSTSKTGPGGPIIKKGIQVKNRAKPKVSINTQHKSIQENRHPNVHSPSAASPSLTVNDTEWPGLPLSKTQVPTVHKTAKNTKTNKQQPTNSESNPTNLYPQQ